MNSRQICTAVVLTVVLGALSTSSSRVSPNGPDVIELTTAAYGLSSDDVGVEKPEIICVKDDKPDDVDVASFGCPRNATPEVVETVVPPTPAPKDPDFSVHHELRPNETPEVSTIVTHKRIKCLCGVPKQSEPSVSAGVTFDERIVGGVPAKISEYPWTVGLLRTGFFGIGEGTKPFCGGTLINNRYVVTASHCVDGQIPSTLRVLINEEDLTTASESNTTKYNVEAIIMHPGYDRQRIDNDIALLKLATPVNFDTDGNIRPVCLPATNTNDFTGLNATTCGWGTTMQGGSQAKTLLKVDVPVISNDVCNSDKTKYKNKITSNMLCAGDVDEGGKDACQGDSGGPLIIENGGRRTLIGVVSWGYGCAQPQSPGVYTRVARYPEWILRHTQDAEWCA